MSSLALMRWLESAPERYDVGMRVITLGRVGRIHSALSRAAVGSAGERVLEIGCGTGALTERLVARGARVTALDQNPEMLERARTRLQGVPAKSVRFVECTASEIDGLEETAFDAVVASFCLSEMSSDERAYVLAKTAQRLAANGVLAIADEVRPERPVWRFLHLALRIPQALAAWLLAGSLSRPIPALQHEIATSGFEIEHEQRWLLGSLALYVARRRA